MDSAPMAEGEIEYLAALREVESLMSATANSPEGERLDALVSWIEAYERQHMPMTQTVER